MRLPAGEIDHWADRYECDDKSVLSVVSAVKQRGFLSKDEFLAVCHWKSPRTQARCRANSEDFIRDVTHVALSTPSERLRIEVLTLLGGVSWPAASVILHFFHREQYPILDFRALWSLRCAVPKQYGFQFWQEYTECCRGLARNAAVSMRTLDRALWQYSNEKQT